jgi:uncharacterized protein (TIGR02598 family)
MKPMKRASSPNGFSLVEVVLSVGIVAVAFLAVFSLLPAGLELFHQALDNTVCANIVQRVTNDAEQTDFNTLLSNPGNGDYFVMPVRYFDDQGTEIKVQNVGAPSPTELAKILYWVRVRGSLPGYPDPAAHTADYFTSLPSTSAERFNPRNSTFLTIQIVANRAGIDLVRLLNSDDLIDGTKACAANLPLQTYSIVISRNGN